jgi:16S rRNA (guanine527-N7)-methyltransferase
MDFLRRHPGRRSREAAVPGIWEELRTRALRQFSVALGAEEIGRLRRFVELVENWSEATRLVSFRDRGELVFRHVLDSLAVCPMLRPGDTWADIGSGAGFPGIPLATIRREPGWLVESRRRRANFLRHVTRELGLGAVEVFHGRAEDFSQPLQSIVGRGIVTKSLLEVARRLLPREGRVLLMLKASAEIPEVPGFRRIDTLVYELPGGLRHKVVALERCFT